MYENHKIYYLRKFNMNRTAERIGKIATCVYSNNISF